MPRQRRSLRLFALAVAGCVGGPLGAQTAGVEAAVKATYLSKFAAYVSWPGGGRGGLTLCVVGDDQLGRLAGQAVEGQSVDGRPIAVRLLPVLAADSACDVAYLGGSRRQSVGAALALSAGRPMLSVTDARRAGDRGVIHFEARGGRIRFHVDEAAAARQGLTISSKLLSLALSIKPRQDR